MIQAHQLTKRYGDKTAVHTLSFTIAPGTVTGFLGPNGAGKSTTMRLIMGLDRPTSGTVTVNGKLYGQHRSPLREVGALLDAKAVHPGRVVPSEELVEEVLKDFKPEANSNTLAGTLGAFGRRIGNRYGAEGWPFEAYYSHEYGSFVYEMDEWVAQKLRSYRDA